MPGVPTHVIFKEGFRISDSQILFIRFFPWTHLMDWIPRGQGDLNSWYFMVFSGKILKNNTQSVFEKLGSLEKQAWTECSHPNHENILYDKTPSQGLTEARRGRNFLIFSHWSAAGASLRGRRRLLITDWYTGNNAKIASDKNTIPLSLWPYGIMFVFMRNVLKNPKRPWGFSTRHRARPKGIHPEK